MEKYLAVYLRLSVEDGDIVIEDEKQESDSISHQRDLIQEYRKRNDLIQMQSLEFVDDGYSGTNFNRPAIKKLLEQVKAGMIGCIIVKDISRFGRDYLEVGDYLEQVFPFMGVRFISVNDHYDSNNYIGTTGGIEVAFKSFMYEMYSKDLSIKMRSALQIRRKRGDYIGTQPPFGYMFSKDKKKLTVDPVAAEYVKYIFKLASLGYSTGMIAKKLNEEAIPTPGQYKNVIAGKEIYHIKDGVGFWRAKKVLDIIENKEYLGMSVNSKTVVNKVGGNKFVRVPDEQRIYVPNMHEAIISNEVYQKAAQAIKNRGQQKYKTHKKREKSILLGKLYCGICHRSLVREEIKTKASYFKCIKASYHSQSLCPKMKLQEPYIEAIVWKCIQSKTKRFENLQTEIADNKDILDIEKQIGKLIQDSEKMKSDKQQAYEKYKAGLLCKDRYMEQIQKIREVGIANGNRLEELKKVRKEVDKKTEMAKETDVFTELTKVAVDTLIEKIYVYDENNIEVIWKDRLS